MYAPAVGASAGVLMVTDAAVMTFSRVSAPATLGYQTDFYERLSQTRAGRTRWITVIASSLPLHGVPSTLWVSLQCCTIVWDTACCKSLERYTIRQHSRLF